MPSGHPQPPSLCEWEECNEPRKARGYCKSHYSKARNLGLIEKLPKLSDHPCIRCGENTRRKFPDGRVDSYCKPCHNAFSQEHRNKSKDEINAARREHRRVNPSHYWAIELKRNYSITPEEYNRMLEEQNYGCYICHDIEKKLHVDHDHDCCEPVRNVRPKSCGKCVRGLLCSECNKGLGHFRDSVKLLLNAAYYLERDYN